MCYLLNTFRRLSPTSLISNSNLDSKYLTSTLFMASLMTWRYSHFFFVEIWRSTMTLPWLGSLMDLVTTFASSAFIFDLSYFSIKLLREAFSERRFVFRLPTILKHSVKNNLRRSFRPFSIFLLLFFINLVVSSSLEILFFLVYFSKLWNFPSR